MTPAACRVRMLLGAFLWLSVFGVDGCVERTSTLVGRTNVVRPMPPERRGIGMLTDFVRADHRTDPALDVHRSLAVTSLKVLEGFSFQDVMEQIACPEQSSCGPNERGPRAVALFQQWWATQKDPECSAVGGGYACPRPEGQLASENPFAKNAGPAAFMPIALFNRIDLADTKGVDCGEYRIVFARVSGRNGPEETASRVLVNFEAVLPNPLPDPLAPLRGCAPIARFWSELSAVDLGEAARRLRDFYFEGRFPDGSRLPWPVVHPDNYGARGCARNVPACPTGQVRTNQRMGLPWLLREFQLARTTSGGRIVFQFVPAAVGDTTAAARFGKAGTTSDFQQMFLDHLPLLLRPDIDTFCYGTGESAGCSGLPTAFTGWQSSVEAQGDSDYLHHFGLPDLGFLARIEQRLTPPVTFPGQLIARAQVLSCAGCHQLSGGHDLGGFRWPEKTMAFVHVTERETTGIGPEERYVVSSVVERLLLRRQRILESLRDGR